MTDMIALDKIRLDGGTQPRAEIYDDTVAEYIEGIGRGDTFPPLVVFFDGTEHWLADGFHRFHAARDLHRESFPCDVRQGTLRDAILFSVGANHTHGRRRTNEDKRRCVRTMLENDLVRIDPDTEKPWSAARIAARCRVDDHTVAKIRTEIAPAHTSEIRSTEVAFPHWRTGETAVMNTANIGRGASPRPRLPVADDWKDEPEPCSASTAGLAAYQAMQTIKAAAMPLPDDPADAVRDFPAAHRESVSPGVLRLIGNWLLGFAEAWERQEQAP